MLKHWMLLAVAVMAFGASSWAADVKTVKDKDGWRLLVDGKPFFIKGMVYYPDKVGESSYDNTRRDWMIVDDDHDGRIDTAYQSWVDKNRNNLKDPDEPEVGDFQLLKDMGCNVIRIYHHASSDPAIQALNPGSLLISHPPNKALLRDLYKNYGIYVMMGDLIGAYTVGTGVSGNPGQGTDYRDPLQRANMLKSVEDMVKEFKDEPYILLWALGNENNYKQFTQTNAQDIPEVYAQFVNEAARLIHKLDPHHPVCLVNGETQNIEVYAKYAPEVDIMGLNSYRNMKGFNTLWKEVAAKVDRPALLTEFGTGFPPVVNGVMDENRQAAIHKACWLDIVAHAAGKTPPGNAIGGFVFCFLDVWWQDGNPSQQDLVPSGWHQEWNGLASQGNGYDSPRMRQLRKVYNLYSELWKEDVVNH